jgi:hypothetical protein
MANPNVIDYATFSKSRALTRSFSEVREPDTEYGDNDLAAQITALLNQPLWPQFPDGAYLKADQATRFYRLAHAVNGLTHCLNRSANSHTSQDYDDLSNAAAPLTTYRQSQLWNALIELSGDLLKLADELQAQAESTN